MRTAKSSVKPTAKPTSTTAGKKKRRSTAKRKPIDGGFVALSGFYFQFLATLSDYVEKAVLDGSSTGQVDPRNALLGAVLGVEIDDQDQVQIAGKRVRIVQIKFSNNPDTDIAPQEADDILRKMHTFADDNFTTGEGWSREFVLLTNRKQSPHVQKLKDKQPTPSRAKYPLLEGYLRSCEWKLRTIDECWKTVEGLGREFGMLGDRNQGEVSHGVANVWKKFLEEVIQKHGWLSKAQVEEAFAGYPNPHRLNGNEVRKYVQDDVANFLANTKSVQLPVASSTIYRQDLLDRVREAVAQSPVVIIEGYGGNGKSTLLGQLASEWSQDNFAAGQEAVDLGEYWPCHCISLWRNKTSEPILSERTKVALKRLPAPWPNTPTSLFVLDGIDEAELDFRHIRKLVTEFRDLPTELRAYASLLITCRRAGDVAPLRNTIEQNGKCQVVSVVEFSNAEVRNSLEGGRVALGADVRNAILSALDAPQLGEETLSLPALRVQDFNRSRGDFEVVGAQAHRRASKNTVHPRVLHSLRHPIVWRHFCSPEIDDSKRILILQDDEEAWSALAEAVVRWFGDACRDRAADRPAELSTQAIEVLLAVGAACPLFEEPGTQEKQRYTRKQWEDVANKPQLRHHPVLAIYSQAVSSGISTLR